MGWHGGGAGWNVMMWGGGGIAWARNDFRLLVGIVAVTIMHHCEVFVLKLTAVYALT